MPEPQKNRHLKGVCPVCGYVARVTAKWLKVGAPKCPVHRRKLTLDVYTPQEVS